MLESSLCFEAIMESVVLEMCIFFLICVEISSSKDAVHSRAYEGIFRLCVPRIKNSLKIIQELSIFFMIVKKCMETRNFIPVVRKLAKMAIELALSTDNHLERVPIFRLYGVNVSPPHLNKTKLNFR